MRFDVDRVVALADAWVDPGRPRAGDDRRAAEEVARQFELAKLRVERVATVPAVARPVTLTVELALCVALAICHDSGLVALPDRLRFVAAVAAPILLMAWWSRLPERKVAWSRRPEHVLGLPIRDDDRRSARVVLVARFSPPGLVARESLLGLGMAMIGVYLAALALVAALEPRHSAGFGTGWIARVVLLAWMLMMIRASRRLPGDRRMGLAMLTELARTWPKGIGNRVETWFVATPNVVALAWALARRGGPPTLVIDLARPEIGSRLILSGGGDARRLADGAARDLWLPHRLRSWPPLPSAFAFRALGLPCLALGMKQDRRPANPALLSGTAQLIVEIALRWAKRAGAADQAESVARSSQNRG